MKAPTQVGAFLFGLIILSIRSARESAIWMIENFVVACNLRLDTDFDRRSSWPAP